MTYRYGGTETLAAEAERLNTAKQQARQELRERQALLYRLRRQRRELEELEARKQHLDTEIRHLSAVKTLPQPRYGGEAGLLAAAAEAAAHERTKREAA